MPRAASRSASAMRSPALWPSWKGLLATAALLLFTSAASAIDMDASSEESIKSAASQTIYNMMTYYHGNETGQIPGSYPTKWWEGSALLLALIQYWHFTGDDSNNPALIQALEWQGGENGDYKPANYSQFLGNDDQMFWGVAAMTAAELKLPESEEGEHSWLSLAQGVYNSQTELWDTKTCGGGLRWQMTFAQQGYDLKNSISNGGLFQIAARLYRYTNDEQYAKMAHTIWDWASSSPLINPQTWSVADSTNVPDCKNQGNEQWSYNYGSFLMGAAYMYNHTQGDEQAKWEDRVDGLLGVLLKKFFPQDNGGVFEEISCEKAANCNFNEILFKGVTSSWLSFTALLVPKTNDQIMPKIKSSATAAAASCSGENNACSIVWYEKKSDGGKGMEQEISSSDVIIASLAQFAGSDSGPVTSTTGGNSTSNPDAGKGGNDDIHGFTPITTGDKVGAGFLTVFVLGSWTAGVAWLVLTP